MGSSVRRLACIGAGAFISVSVAAAPTAAAAPSRQRHRRIRVSGNGRSTGAVVRPFEQPSSVYGAGHRGVDFAASPGTPVRAANDGIVTFAGTVAGTLHVTIAHGGTLRTSYSFLQSVAVHEGQTVARGDMVGTAGRQPTPTTTAASCTSGASRRRYVDPMLLFRPDDLTKLVHLVPAADPEEQPWTPADERRELQTSLHLPLPSTACRPRRSRRG